MSSRMYETRIYLGVKSNCPIPSLIYFALNIYVYICVCVSFMSFNVYMYIVFIYLFTYTLFFDYNKSGPSYIHHLKASPSWLWRPKYFDPVFDGWNTNQEVPNLESHICSDMKASNFTEPSSRWRISSNGEDVTFYWSTPWWYEAECNKGMRGWVRMAVFVP